MDKQGSGTLAASLAVAAAFAAATGIDALPPRIDDGDRVVLHGNVHPLAQPAYDVGLTNPALPMERMILSLKPRADRLADLQRLLTAQQDPSSPDYHRWLTPEQFGARFGPSSDDLAAVEGWLASQGFVVDEVAKGRLWINFTGRVDDVDRAFRTEIHDYLIGTKLHHANATDPSIPRALSDIVAGVVSLHDFRAQPMHRLVRAVGAPGATPNTNMTNGSHTLSPADFATIYDVNPLYATGIDGTGQSIAIVARTDINLSDVQYFRSFFGLPPNDPQFILNGPDPGIVPDDELEGDLDAEWGGAIARNATVKFVISKSTASSGGEALSAQYIVNNNLAPVMSESFGLCESSLGTSGNAFYNNLWTQAATQGITAFVSSGDNGAAGCDKASATTGTVAAVNGICSSPNSVCVGGTQFMDTANPDAFWAPTNDPVTYGSAFAYVPEQGWNESGSVAGGSELWSSGGGASVVYGKPAWQVAPGVPSDGARDVPDVSLSAAAHDGYLVYKEHSASSSGLVVVEGTSASSPSLAAVMTLIVQKTGSRQGNANPRFYQLASAQYGGGGAAVFHDVTVGDNTVPGVTGYSCGAGYDQVTGLGSIDAWALANNWTTSSGGGTVTVYSDGFEGAFPGQWRLAYASTPSGQCTSVNQTVTWGRSTYRSASGSASLWCAAGGTNAQPPGGSYAPCMGTFAIYGPFSLADAVSASLDFDLWLSSETNYDYVWWMISTDGSSFSGYKLSGSTNGWAHEHLNFSDVGSVSSIGAPQVWVAFYFNSDESTQYEGAYLDNVVIAKALAGTSCTFSINPSSQSFPAAGGGGTVGVSASSGSCAWTAASNFSWVHITSGASGTGNGTVQYSVDANGSDADRTGTFTVAGQTFTVNQAAAACSPPTITAQPASVTISSGQTATLSVAASGATGYQWYQGSSGDTSNPIAGATTTSYTTPALTATESFWVQASNACGSANSNTATVTVTGGGAQLYLIPSVSHLPGANNTTWRTDVSIVNASGSTAYLQLSYGSVTDSTTASYATSLGPGANVLWRDVLVAILGLASGGQNRGALLVSSNVPLAVISRTYNQGATGTFGQSYPALTPSWALTTGQTGILPLLANDAATRSNVGAVNLSASGTCSILFTVYGASGAQIGHPVTLTVNAGSYAQQNNLIPATGVSSSVDVAYATVQVQTPGCQAWAYASPVDNSSGDPTTIEVIVP